MPNLNLTFETVTTHIGASSGGGGKSGPAIGASSGGPVRKYHGNPWNLTPGRNIRRDAVDYYLLTLLNFVELDEGHLEVHLGDLTTEFAAYTDMAVGGEIRHATGKVKASTIPKPLRGALKSGLIPKHRHIAWANWLYFRQQHGVIALKWARNTFNQNWGGSYGGPLWGAIANVLWRFERGEITPATFVDTCFGLQHNGGCYFNKAHASGWDWSGIKGILDLNQASQYSQLVPNASKYVRDLISNNLVELKDSGVWA